MDNAKVEPQERDEQLGLRRVNTAVGNCQCVTKRERRASEDNQTAGDKHSRTATGKSYRPKNAS